MLKNHPYADSERYENLSQLSIADAKHVEAILSRAHALNPDCDMWAYSIELELSRNAESNLYDLAHVWESYGMSPDVASYLIENRIIDSPWDY